VSDLILRGASRPLIGDIRVPGDKSIAHRAVLFSALAHGRSRVRGLSGGEDNNRTVAACRALGVRIESGPGSGPDPGGELIIESQGLDGLRSSATTIDCGNSGTTMRLLAGVLASRPFATTLVGDQYLEARPMRRVAEPLGRMGATITGRTGVRGELYPPLTIGRGGQGGSVSAPLHGIDYVSPQASAQVKSAILLAGLAAEGTTRVCEPAPSRDHTERMLRAQGVPLIVEKGLVQIEPAGWDRRLLPLDVTVPGDLSSAAFLLGAAAIVPGSVLVLRGVGVNPTRTGVLDALVMMGAALSIDVLGEVGGEPVADVTVWGSPLRGIEIAGALTVRAIDELPLLAAVAAHAEGETVIRDARELRVKESDRIASMVAALTGLGIDAEEREDGLVIRGRPGPGKVRGGQAKSAGDHRIAMAAAVCALFAEGPSRIEDAANIATSFPSFVPLVQGLGAELELRP
jgi:3-phosphoshikimate 1-carboxyvinyltransferase